MPPRPLTSCGPLAPLLAAICLSLGCDKAADAQHDIDPVMDVPAAKPLPPGMCVAFGKPAAQGTLNHPAVTELSGLAESVRHPGVLWAHNDSGDTARLLALNADASVRAMVELQGAKARDWEDMALGPCHPKEATEAWGCLYVGDMGDNDRVFEKGYLFRVQEPLSLPPAATVTATVTLAPSQWKAWTLPWPDGPRDVEALATLADGRLILLTKEQDKGLAEVYRVVLGVGSIAYATRLGELATLLPDVKDGLGVMVTAADLTLDGSQMLVRTYLRLFRFEVGNALLLGPAEAKKALATAPRYEVPFTFELQGEAVAWSRKGGYWHASEKYKTVVPKLFRVPCLGP